MFSQQLKRLAGPALTVGGLFWITIFMIIVIIGVQTGKLEATLDARTPALARIGIWFLPLSVLPLGVGLLGVFSRLEGHARGLGVTGVVFASLGMALGISDLVVLSDIFGSSVSLSSRLGGGAVFATAIGTGFLGWAALRACLLPRWMAWTLILIGIVTIPILFATPLPIGPNWATDFLAFLVSGIAYTVVGATLVVAGKGRDENARGASVATAAQAK